MKRLLSALVFAAVTCAAGSSVSAEPGGAILTVAGADVTAPNRGRTEEFSDPFFLYNDQSFERARSFALADLKAMPQHDILVDGEDWAAPITASGPRLADVLAKAGVAESTTISIVALDGYTQEFTQEDREAHDWVLSLTIDGEPLGLGGRGPLWLLRDTTGETIKPGQRSKWVWAAYLIRAD